MLKKLFSLFAALTLSAGLWASNTITYTAMEKLISPTLGVGETTFGSAITSHDFSNGIGTITCDGEITTIGENAFRYCYGLTSITIPNSVTTIGGGAFESCSALTSVTFLGNACQEGIGNNAFKNVGKTDPALLTLPNSWTGTLPDEDGNWYGGVFNLSEVPTALPETEDSKFKIQNSKLIQNGQLLIRKDGKNYNVLGGRVK